MGKGKATQESILFGAAPRPDVSDGRLSPGQPDSQCRMPRECVCVGETAILCCA